MFRRIREIENGFWAIADQSVVSLGNFLTNIILARILVPNEYGAYAVLFGALIFLYSLHGAVVTYPLLVRGAPATADRLRKLTSFSLVLTAVIAIALGTFLIITAWTFGKITVGVWAAVALVFWIIQETLRRGLMAHMRYREALLGDTLSYIGQATVLIVLGLNGWLTLESAFMAMAGTSGVAAVLQAKQVGVSFVSISEIHELLGIFWNLGRWLLLNSLVAVFSVQFFPWALALSRGASQAAALQALINVLSLTNPILISITNLVTPASAKAWRETDKKAASRVAIRYAVHGGVLIFPYLLVSIVWPQHVLAMLYGQGSPYEDFSSTLRVLAGAHGVFYVSAIMATLLNALEQARTNFLVLSVSAIVSVMLGIPLIAWAGLWGAASAIALGIVVRTVILTVAVRRESIDLRRGQPQFQGSA